MNIYLKSTDKPTHSPLVSFAPPLEPQSPSCASSSGLRGPSHPVSAVVRSAIQENSSARSICSSYSPQKIASKQFLIIIPVTWDIPKWVKFASNLPGAFCSSAAIPHARKCTRLDQHSKCPVGSQCKLSVHSSRILNFWHSTRSHELQSSCTKIGCISLAVCIVSKMRLGEYCVKRSSREGGEG